MKGMYEEALPEAKAFFTGVGLAEISGAMNLAAEILLEFSCTTFIAPYFISYVYAFAGKKEQTLEWLERAYEMKDPNMPYIYAGIFDILRDNPRFQDLLRRMNLSVVK